MGAFWPEVVAKWRDPLLHGHDAWTPRPSQQRTGFSKCVTLLRAGDPGRTCDLVLGTPSAGCSRRGGTTVERRSVPAENRGILPPEPRAWRTRHERGLSAFKVLTLSLVLADAADVQVSPTGKVVKERLQHLLRTRAVRAMPVRADSGV